MGLDSCESWQPSAFGAENASVPPVRGECGENAGEFSKLLGTCHAVNRLSSFDPYDRHARRKCLGFWTKIVKHEED